MTTEARQGIFEQIEAERAYQDGKWGVAFDDANTLNDWTTYIVGYAYRGAAMENKDNKQAQRAALVKVAAIAVAALEAFDRNGEFAPRHYDPHANQAAAA